MQMASLIKCISRSEQAPGSVFHPPWRKYQNLLWFFGTFVVQYKIRSWKINTRQIIKKIGEQCTSSKKGEFYFSKKKIIFLSEISLKFEICSFLSGSIQQEKQLLREIENYISYRMCLVNENFILLFDVTFFSTSR